MEKRKINAREFFERVEACADPESAGITEAVVQFVLDGTDEGALHYTILKGRTVMHPGHHDRPDVVIRTRLEEWVLLTLGMVGPFRAYLSGRVEVNGDIVLAQRVLKLFKSTFLFEEDLLVDMIHGVICAPARTGREGCA